MNRYELHDTRQADARLPQQTPLFRLSFSMRGISIYIHTGKHTQTEESLHVFMSVSPWSTARQCPSVKYVCVPVTNNKRTKYGK